MATQSSPEVIEGYVGPGFARVICEQLFKSMLQFGESEAHAAPKPFTQEQREAIAPEAKARTQRSSGRQKQLQAMGGNGRQPPPSPEQRTSGRLKRRRQQEATEIEDTNTDS